MSTLEVTRLEIIDNEGRVFVKYYEQPMYIQESYQDGGRTLKLFLTRVEV